jgi:PAS domain-containing protein
LISITNAPVPHAGWVSTHDDVTEERRAEQERDRSQNFLNTILENVPAPIFVKEVSGLRYVLVNRAGETFWGISRAEMIGKTSYEIFAKEEADLIGARDVQLLRSDQPILMNVRFAHPAMVYAASCQEDSRSVMTMESHNMWSALSKMLRSASTQRNRFRTWRIMMC